MELAETVEFINKQLAIEFGRFSDNTSNWRIVLAADQYEKRLIDVTEEGLELLIPEVKEVRKYQHIKPDRYVLERKVPVEGQTDLVTKTSYEPAWTFEDRFGNYLPPRFDACKIIIEVIYGNMKRDLYAKYRDRNTTKEDRELELKKMEELLFGNETPTGDALAHGYGVVVPESRTIQ